MPESTKPITLVIPTYNERENLPSLVAALAQLKLTGFSLIIVDDRSPDGTGVLADELRQTYPWVSVIHRAAKAGLGTAYVEGFRQALRQGAVLVAQMDADWSHDPSALPELIRATDAGADLVLGSRYVPGGKIQNWGWIRRAISRGGNWYARRVLGLPYRDLTGGYKVYRRNVLETIDLSRVSSTGYNFQIETTTLAHWHGFAIREIPITFTERRGGRSKFNRGIILEAFWRVWLLRRQRPANAESRITNQESRNRQDRSSRDS